MIEALEEELDNNKNYKWDGNRFKLSVEGTLKETIDDIVAFHKENHAFLDKKGNLLMKNGMTGCTFTIIQKK